MDQISGVVVYFVAVVVLVVSDGKVEKRPVVLSVGSFGGHS